MLYFNIMRNYVNCMAAWPEGIFSIFGGSARLWFGQEIADMQVCRRPCGTALRGLSTEGLLTAG